MDPAWRTGTSLKNAAVTSSEASPIATTARTGGTVLARSERSRPLLRPPAISTTEVKPLTPARTAAGVVALESSYQETPPDWPTSCTRCAGGSVLAAASLQPSGLAPAAMATARAAAVFARSWGNALGRSPAGRKKPWGPAIPSGLTRHTGSASAAPKETTSTPAGMLTAARLTTGSSALTTATQPGPWDAQILAFALEYWSRVGCQSRWSGAKLSQQLTSGRNFLVYSNWNDETSTTRTPSLPREMRPTASSRGYPTLPAATASLPEEASIATTNFVTVVLPLVPVIATSPGRSPGPLPIPSSTCQPSSISDRTSTPKAFAATSAGCPTGTPGLGTTRSALQASFSARSGPRPIWTVRPGASTDTWAARATSGSSSRTTTSEPWLDRKSV